MKRARKARRSAVSQQPQKDLAKAAANYGEALRLQDTLATALHLAYERREDATALDREHSAACDAVGAAEHELLVCGAIVGGWTREDAEESV